MAALVNVIGRPAIGSPQEGEVFWQTPEITNPADASASGFYITNSYNRFVGNAASGGWSGYAFVNLPLPIGMHTNRIMDPSARPTLEFDGNTV